jgi:type II secretory pathway component PulC
MVRSLLIRQLFLWVNLLLIFAMAVPLYYTVRGLFDPVPTVDTSLPSDALAGDGSSAITLVKERPVYDAIVTARLFGNAGAYDPNAAPPPPPPPPPQPTEVDTSLNLRLVGTSVAEDNPLFSTAIIENMDQRGNIRTYAVNQEVVEKVKLVEVRPREVVLLNEKASPPQREVLRMQQGEIGQALAAAAPAPKPDVVTVGGVDRVTIKRDEFIQDLYNNYTDLITKVHPQMYRDSSGNIVGITADNISQIPLAAKLGLQDGDVLQTVNNELIDSEQKIMEIMQKYQNADTIRIGILRDGKAKVITYKVQ